MSPVSPLLLLSGCVLPLLLLLTVTSTEAAAPRTGAARSSSTAAALSVPKQLSKTSECERDGFSSTAQYRQYVTVGASQFLPVFSSVDLTQPLQVKSLLVFVHGIGGNANTFFCDVLKAVPASVGVVAPWFGNEAVRLRDWAGKAAETKAGSDPTSLYWSGGGWNQGAGAANAPSVSSFAALDALVASVAGSSGGSSALRQIVVAGFSAGAQLVQRYAWATSYGPGSSPPVKFVVSDPSTYLYFDDRRPEAACRPDRDTGASWSCTKFVRSGAAISSCPAYNNYRLGLAGLSASDSPYFAQARISSAPGALSTAYLQKSILYVFGGADACNCNTKGYVNPASCIQQGAKCSPSTAGPSCCDMPGGVRTNSFVDVNCGEMLQGSNRLQRGLLFTQYLRVFSNGQHSPQVVVVPGMGHDQVPMLNSPQFLSFVSA